MVALHGRLGHTDCHAAVPLINLMCGSVREKSKKSFVGGRGAKPADFEGAGSPRNAPKWSPEDLAKSRPSAKKAAESNTNRPK